MVKKAIKINLKFILGVDGIAQQNSSPNLAKIFLFIDLFCQISEQSFNLLRCFYHQFVLVERGKVEIKVGKMKFKNKK